MDESVSSAVMNGETNQEDVTHAVDSSAAVSEPEDQINNTQLNQLLETAEFAYPQVPVKMTQQDSTLQQSSEERPHGGNSWEESFDASSAGATTLAEDLQVPCLESTRIASTPFDFKKVPFFGDEGEISRVQLPSVDAADRKKPQETDDRETEGHDEVSASTPVDVSVNFSPSSTTEAASDKEVFQSPENHVGAGSEAELKGKTSQVDQSETTTDEQKSTLDKAFISESSQNPAESLGDFQRSADQPVDGIQSTDETPIPEDSDLEQNVKASSADRDRANSPVLDVKVPDRNAQVMGTVSATAAAASEAPVEVAVCKELEAPQPQQDVVDAPRLPHTVTELTGPLGVKIYLVGTAHFSLESQKDVSLAIAVAQPNVVMVELCRSRLNILHMDEEAILKEAKDINMAKIRETIRQHGAVQGALYLLFLSTSAHLTRQLGMAPGGEFRRAYNEARNVPGCTVHLGDRPIHVTLQRALGALSLWQKMKLVWHLLLSRESISPEEVERCKQRDLLEELLKEMTGEFPALSRVFVQERDLCLAHSLQIAAAAAADQQRMRQDNKTPSVVAVVGIGHVSGIVSYFGKVNESDVRQVMKIPPPSRSAKVIRGVVKYGLIGLICYGAYKVLPVPRIETLFK